MAERYLIGGFPVAPGDWLKPRDAAALAGVGVRALWSRERAGLLPQDGVKRTHGGHRRYRAGVIIAMREEARQ